MPEDAKAQLITVADGVYVRQAVDNMTWTDLGDYAIAVDALEQPELESEVFQAIQSTLGDRPVRYLLNTHTHGDHTALNPAFQRRYGSQVVNQRAADIAPEGRWFEGARRRVQMLPMPGVHSGEDCIVWVPDARVLCSGDLFGWGMIPLVGGLTDEVAEDLMDAYSRMLELEPRAVVPGHGPLASARELKRFVDYFRWLCEAVRGAAAGASERELQKAVPPPDDMRDWWRFASAKHPRNVGIVARAVGRGFDWPG
ncbi:MAG: MBL fold metallo-hydrolase [Candidatus Brocadiia bacterium]